jgi:Cation transporting ATPase, C-terminus
MNGPVNWRDALCRHVGPDLAGIDPEGLFPLDAESFPAWLPAAARHAVTATAVAGQLGIDGAVLTGAEFGAMSDEEALNEIHGIGGAGQVHRLVIARTMGMVTFALLILFFSIESKDERDSAFSLGTFSDKTFAITTSGSFVLLVLSTVMDIFHTVMKTVRLGVRQWLICTAVALPIVAAAEIRKAVLRRTAAARDAGQPVTSSSSRMSMTPWAINAAPTTASCSAQVRT